MCDASIAVAIVKDRDVRIEDGRECDVCEVKREGHSSPAIFVVAFPSLEILEETETEVHALLALVLVGVTILAFYRGYVQHRRKDIVAIASAGMLLILSALFLHNDHDIHHAHMSAEATVTTVGSILLIVAHLLNLRNMTCCKSSSCSH